MQMGIVVAWTKEMIVMLIVMVIVIEGLVDHR